MRQLLFFRFGFWFGVWSAKVCLTRSVLRRIVLEGAEGVGRVKSRCNRGSLGIESSMSYYLARWPTSGSWSGLVYFSTVDS